MTRIRRQPGYGHETDLAVARRLATSGLPVFVASPNPDFDPDVKDPRDRRSREFEFPQRWQYTVADPAALDGWEPGCAVCLVAGADLDVVDVDTKNGADVDDQRRRLNDAGVVILGEASTPSGGRHLYVASTGICSLNRPDLGVDYRGRGSDGSGAGLVYLPGTSRPKYDGAGFRWF